MTVLSVNLNKIALLRNARGGTRPDIVACARTVLDAGAGGITVHPRPDARHIRADDVYALKELVDAYPDTELNIEGNPTASARKGYPGFDHLIETVRPHQCTLVPDEDAQLTSDHGWNLTNDDAVERLRGIVAGYRSWGARVSLFMDPVRPQIAAAKRTGADRIELFTGPYADVVAERGLDHARTRMIWRKYRDAARYANERGFGVNAGHDLDLVNLARFLSMGGVAEVSIGHALVADALGFGLTPTVKRYLRELEH